MKTTGVSSIPKFGLLGFLGHPNVQGMFRVCSEYVQSMFRACSEYVQSLLVVKIVVIALSSASSVSVFGIFQIAGGIIDTHNKRRLRWSSR